MHQEIKTYLIGYEKHPIFKGSQSKPIGLVHIGLASSQMCISRTKQFGPRRQRTAIQKLTVFYALDQLRLLLLMRS